MATKAQIELTATDKTRQAFVQVERNFAGLQRSADGFARIAGGLGGVLSAGALVGFARSAISSAAALDDMAQSTGASVEGLSRLTDIARSTGQDIGQVENALVRLTRALAGTDDESKGAGAAIAALGLDFAKLRQQSPDQALQSVAKAFANFEDGAGKTAAALAIFGRQGAQLLPLLNDIAEQSGRAASLTEEQAKQASRLEDAWNSLSVAAGNFARNGLFKVIEGYQRLATSIERFGTFGGLTNFFKGDFADATRPQIQARIDKLQRDLETAKTDAEAVALGEELTRLRAGLVKLPANEAAKPALPFKPPPGRGAGAGRTARAAADRFPDGGRFPDLVTGPDSEIALATDALFEQSEAAAKLADRYRDLADPIAKYRDQLAEITQLEQAGRLSQDEAVAARAAVNDQIARASGLTRDLADATKDADELARDLGQSLSNTFTDALQRGDSLRDLLKAMAIDIANIAFIQPAQKAAGSALGSLFSSFNLGSLIPKFAEGTDYVPRDMLAIVHRGEAIIPAAQNRGGGGVTLVQNISMDNRGADAGVDARIRAGMARARDEAVAAVKALSDRGGAYARAVGRR